MELQIIEQREVLGKEFKIYGTIENPLFLAKDVAEWIDYAYKDARKVSRDVSNMLKTVDDDEKVKSTLKLGGEDYSHGGLRENTEMWFLTEDGLYEVLMQSRKPIAKAFKKEVKKILKQIRQTGGYIPINKEDDEKSIMAKGYLIAMKTIEKQDELLKQKDEQIKRLELVRVKGRTLNDAAACTGHPRKDIEEHCYKEKWYSKINGDVIIHKENLVTRKRKNAIEFTEEGFDLITKLFKKSKQKSII